jgi:hypothetical protein
MGLLAQQLICWYRRRKNKEVQMEVYGGIDLYSNNNVVALSDEANRIVCRKRLPNNLALNFYILTLTRIIHESLR